MYFPSRLQIAILVTAVTLIVALSACAQNSRCPRPRSRRIAFNRSVRNRPLDRSRPCAMHQRRMHRRSKSAL